MHAFAVHVEKNIYVYIKVVVSGETLSEELRGRDEIEESDECGGNARNG